MAKIFWAATLFGLLFSYCQAAIAQESGTRPALEVDVEENDYYYQQPKTYQPDARAIVRQKAMARAEQRTIRLANLASWGIHSGRPAVATTPFTASYGPTWQSNPYPFVWLEARRAKYYIVR